MAISGTFAASARPAPRDNTRNWGEGADPRHSSIPMADEAFPRPVPVHRMEIPPFIEDQADPGRTAPAWADADTESGDFGGTRMPHETLAQHDVPTLPWGVRDNDRLRQLSGRLHDLQRRVFPSQMATKVDRQHDERYSSPRLQSLPMSPMGTTGPITGQALRALRGRNSLAVNNPGSPDVSYSGNYVRQGWDISRWTERRMPRRGLSHTKRELHLNLASTALDSPGKEGPYSSPFASFPRLNIGPMKPGARREPRPWDEDVVDDFTGDEYTGYGNWGL
jgi:hypothetical protein